MLALTTGLGCSDDPHAGARAGTVLEGRLEVIVVEGPQGGMRYFLLPDHGDDLVELAFETPPRAASGARILLRGEQQSERFHVAEFDAGELDPDLGSSHDLLLVPDEPERSSTIAFAMVDFGQGINVSRSEAESFMFSTTNPGPTLGLDPNDRSVAQYYQETSYGLQEVTGAVHESLSWSGTACNGSGGSQLAQQLRGQIGTRYDHYIWYYGSEQPNCGYGWGSLGTWSSPSSNVWFNGDLFDGAITHEIGHNLGYQHASSIRCSGTPLANDPMDCQTTEYGSTISVMGNLSNGHMMGIEKWYSGWFKQCNGVRVRSSGTFTLHAIEVPCNGIQVLQIPMPIRTRTFSTDQSGGANPARFYYLEYRAGGGLDTGMARQVMVHASDEIQPPNRVCARSVLMDMNPSTNQVNGMTAGSSFTDPAGGVTFAVTSLTATHAVVDVTLGGMTEPSTCMDGTELAGSGPATCGAGTGGTGGTGGGTSTGGTGGTSTGGAGGTTGGTGGTSTGGAGGTTGGTGGTSTGGAGGMTGGTGGTSTGGTSTGGAGGTSTGGTSTGGAGGIAGTPGGTGGDVTAGSGGSAAASGASGTAGSVSGGAPGSGGSAGVAGTAAAGTGGSVATGGTAPMAAPPAAASMDAGCGCSVPGSSSTPAGAVWLVLTAAAAAVARRRRDS